MKFGHSVNRPAKQICLHRLGKTPCSNLGRFCPHLSIQPVQPAFLRYFGKYQIKSAAFFTGNLKKQFLKCRISISAAGTRLHLLLRIKAFRDHRITFPFCSCRCFQFLSCIGKRSLSVSYRQFIPFRPAQFFYIVASHKKRSADPAVSIFQTVIRIASYVLPVFCIIIKTLIPRIKIGRRHLVPSARSVFDLSGFIVIEPSRCLCTGQKRSISVFVGGCHCHQIIFLVYHAGFSIRVHQILLCKQTVNRTLQNCIALRISIGIIPVILT